MSRRFISVFVTGLIALIVMIWLWQSADQSDWSYPPGAEQIEVASSTALTVNGVSCLSIEDPVEITGGAEIVIHGQLEWPGDDVPAIFLKLLGHKDGTGYVAASQIIKNGERDGATVSFASEPFAAPKPSIQWPLAVEVTDNGSDLMCQGYVIVGPTD